MPEPRYLGDSVYAADENSFMVKLYTDNGDGPRNEIFLEPEVVYALLGWLRQIPAYAQEMLRAGRA